MAQQASGLSHSGHTKAAITISGGTGGLGLLMARWLAASGQVARICLVGRTGKLPEGEATQQLLAMADVAVSVVAADSAASADAAYLWGAHACDAVFHASGVLQVSGGASSPLPSCLLPNMLVLPGGCGAVKQ